MELGGGGREESQCHFRRMGTNDRETGRLNMEFVNFRR